MNPLTIRPSTVSSMMLCPARQTLKDEAEPYVPSEPLVFGSLVHWRIEQHLKGAENLAYDEMIGALEDIFFQDTGEQFPVYQFASKRFLREMINEAMVAFEAWVETVEPKLPDEEPIIERRLEQVLNPFDDKDPVIVMAGTPDAVYPNAGIIVDWKTAGRNWNKDKVESQIQPWAYSLMSGFAINLFIFWVYDRATESWWNHTHLLEEYDHAWKAITEQAISFARLVDSGHHVFTPAGSGWKSRGWHCSPKYCDQWETCDGKYLVADGQATQPALTMKERGWK